MFKRKKKPTFSYEGKKITKLEECTVYCALMSEEEKAWEKLKKHLVTKKLSVWCTLNGWDNFLNRTILTGNVDKIINYLDNFVKEHQAEHYHLTDSGELRVAKIQ